MNLEKYLTPYISYENEIRRLFIKNNRSYFYIENFLVDNNRFDLFKIKFLIKYYPVDFETNDFPRKYYYSEKEAMAALDNFLIQEGFVLLTEEQYKKYAVLL